MKLPLDTRLVRPRDPVIVVVNMPRPVHRDRELVRSRDLIVSVAGRAPDDVEIDEELTGPIGCVSLHCERGAVAV